MEITAAILDKMNTNSLYQALGIQIEAAGGGKISPTLRFHTNFRSWREAT